MVSGSDQPHHASRRWLIEEFLEGQRNCFEGVGQTRISPQLLQSSGGETPLVHAIRTGNKDVAIVLLGAFSRWVNYLDDVDVQKPQTQTHLKALRKLLIIREYLAI